MEEDIEIGEMLKAKREELGLTRYKSAQLSGLFAIQIKDIEENKRHYSYANLLMYLNSLGLKIKIISTPEIISQSTISIN